VSLPCASFFLRLRLGFYGLGHRSFRTSVRPARHLRDGPPGKSKEPAGRRRYENPDRGFAKVGAGRRQANVKTRTLQKPKSAAPAKAIHRIPKQKEPSLRSSGQAGRASFVRVNPFVPQCKPALRNARRVGRNWTVVGYVLTVRRIPMKLSFRVFLLCVALAGRDRFGRTRCRKPAATTK